MKKSFIAIIAAAVLLPSLYAGVSPYFYTAEVKWHSYKEARAMDSEKPIFVFASMRFCTTCAAMEKDVFTDPALAKVLNDDFIAVKETTNFMLSSFVFDDLKDKEGNGLSFKGFPAIMLVSGERYSLRHGYKNIEQLQSMLNSTLLNLSQ